ncbi:hypothetical protein GGR41_002346 [Paenalcaligenes hominis]|uniref:Uncharacterized protein n=1 Tax=Paenalcaligenes hominis TaxID=643674 RepID=A0ABX0WTL9_9BURK|nr:hypothetical protein [Paenalcaligenes hominis]NJB66084.1 hypothetical protein [Paenalcaligenes hominis]
MAIAAYKAQQKQVGVKNHLTPNKKQVIILFFPSPQGRKKEKLAKIIFSSYDLKLTCLVRA